MRAVAVHLDAGLGVVLAVGVAAKMGPTVDDDDVQAEVLRALLRNGQPEEPRADDDKIRVHALSQGLGIAVRLPEQSLRNRMKPRGSGGRSGTYADVSNSRIEDWLPMRTIAR